MSYTVKEKEFDAVMKLPPPKRYSYFLKKVCDWEEIWGIRGQEGWVICGDAEGKECFPVWPAKAFAAPACKDDWKDCEPSPIPLDKWLQSWIDELVDNKRLVAVFPDGDMKSAVVPPEQLRADMLEELAKYEIDDFIKQTKGRTLGQQIIEETKSDESNDHEIQS
jgi:hypothetical protein